MVNDDEILPHLFDQESDAYGEDVRENARVVRVDNEGVWLDIGFKFEARLPLGDWEEDESLPKVGDRISVYIDDDLDVDDRPLKIERITIRRDPKNVHAEEFVANAKVEDIYHGHITRRIRDGFLVDIGVGAFLPETQLSDAMVRDPETLIGYTANWRITEADAERRVISIALA